MKCKRCGGCGTEPDWRELGDAVRTARTQRGMGLRELARAVDCSPAYVSDVEAGRRGGGLGGPKTRAILTYLGITPHTGGGRMGYVHELNGEWFAMPSGNGSAVGPYSTREQAQRWLDGDGQ
jgi:transcriptional regulator with XRE-family HTH domain